MKTNLDTHEQKNLMALNFITYSFLFLIPLVSLWFGLDYAIGALLGCFLVFFNLMIMKKVVEVLLQKRKAPAILTIIYLLKLSFIGAFLYFTLAYFQFDPKVIIGTLVGLSSLFLIALSAALYRFFIVN